MLSQIGSSSSGPHLLLHVPFEELEHVWDWNWDRLYVKQTLYHRPTALPYFIMRGNNCWNDWERPSSHANAPQSSSLKGGKKNYSPEAVSVHWCKTEEWIWFMLCTWHGTTAVPLRCQMAVATPLSKALQCVPLHIVAQKELLILAPKFILIAYKHLLCSHSSLWQRDGIMPIAANPGGEGRCHCHH